MSLGANQTISIRLIAKHDLDFGIERFSLDSVDDRLQVRAAAGNQHADGNLSCHDSSL
jgi:hypothetical protein